MAKEFSRTTRLGDQIQRELAQLLEHEVKDPQLGMVTVTAVRVTRDLAHAKVYVTVLGDALAVQQSMAALSRAAGFLRSALASRILARTTPALHFVYDASVERGARLSALIDAAVAADQRLHDPQQEAGDQADRETDNEPGDEPDPDDQPGNGPDDGPGDTPGQRPDDADGQAPDDADGQGPDDAFPPPPTRS